MTSLTILYISYNPGIILFPLIIGIFLLLLFILVWVATFMKDSFQQYKNLNKSKQMFTKVIFVVILLFVLNFIPYYNIYNSADISVYNIFNQIPDGYILHRTYFFTPVFLGLFSILLLIKYHVVVRIFENEKIKKITRVVTLTLLVLLGSFFLHLINSYNEKIQVDKKQKHYQDSVYLVKSYNDSLEKIKVQKEKKLLKELSNIMCTKAQSLRCFKEWLKKYHPQIKIVSIVEIWDRENCKFGLTCIVNNNKYSFDHDDTLIVEVNLNSDGKYNYYTVEVLTTPTYF
jgi:hypothetical protein